MALTIIVILILMAAVITVWRVELYRRTKDKPTPRHARGRVTAPPKGQRR